MTRNAQNLLYTGIVIVVGLFFYAIRPTYPLTPKGFFLPASTQTYAAQPAKTVKVLHTLPLQFTKVGEFRAQVHYDDLNKTALQAKANTLIQYSRNMVAEKGANAMVITSIGATPGPSPIDSVLIDGLALKTQK